MGDLENQDKPVEEQVEEKTPAQEEPIVEADRPEENYKAELARKNAEIARLRMEMEAKSEPVKKYDANDITTWDENSLKLLAKSNDPAHVQYKDQAEDLLLERKVERLQAKKYEESQKQAAQDELVSKYPEALDPTSDMAQKISKVMREYDLNRSPKGRLVAAKIVAAESKATSSKGQDAERNRVARVKANLVDGDRPKPTESKDSKSKDLKTKLLNEKSTSHDAMAEWIDSKGLREKFGKMWGR